jgi:enamine deaminase RidA (YjgF/YER057c/UK114 family)
MTSTITQKLIELGFEVAKPIVPIANYVQTKVLNCAIYVSGQLPIKDGEVLYKGKVGVELTVEEAKKGAELCMLNILNQLVLALDDEISQIKSCIKLEIFINAIEGFEKHPEIANGASDLLVKVLGERGKHTRVALGVHSLPLNSAVEVTAIFQTTKDRE